jgi:hypothetical protein
MKLIFRIFATIVCLLVIDYWLLRITSVSASEYALGISPAIMEHIAHPASTISTQLVITNNTRVPLPIKGSVRSFLATEPIPPNLAPRFDASLWISLDPADFILQPQESKTVNVYLTAPEDAGPGGHYATILFEPLIPREAVSLDTAVSLARVGTLVFLVVPGDIKESIQLDSWQLPHLLRTSPLRGTLTLSNLGTVHLLPDVKVSLLQHNQLLESQTLKPQTILPGTSREYELNFDDLPRIGPLELKFEIHYGGDQQEIIKYARPIWVVPWPTIVISLITLTLLTKLRIVNIDRLRRAWRVLSKQYD